MKYFVLIADIEKSRNFKNRQAIQDILEKSIESLNNSPLIKKSKIVAPFTITIGDEFQAVLENPSYIMDIINSFEENFRSVNRKDKTDISFRYGFGIGEISTKLNRKAAIGMDGPAFYNARKSLETTKTENKKFHIKSSSEMDSIINLLLDWLGSEVQNWNESKKNALFLYKQKLTQKEIAQKINISQPAVSKIIKNKQTKLAIETEKEVELSFQKMMDN